MSRRWLATLLTFLIPAFLFALVVFGYSLLEHAEAIIAAGGVALTILGLVTCSAGGFAIAKAIADRRPPRYERNR